MALLERYLILIWAGGALLGWIAGDILSTDPALIGWIGEAAAHLLHPWAGRVGALIVVGAGLFLVRRNRRLTMEDILAGVALVIWIAADIGIAHFIADSAILLRWLLRGALVVVLAVGYMALRSGRSFGPEDV
jgi:hypothetical protein